MTAASCSSNKAKIARRVIEVLEYFDDNHREATVMDIVRRYDRPQSSTSELLSSLVELGLLTKDPYSRSYSLTARAALLGTGSQTGAVRDGRLVKMLDRLSAQTGLTVALYGMVGLKAQVISLRSGSRKAGTPLSRLYGGMQDALSQSASGWLLLSTIAQPRCEGVVRRLNAEADEHHKFSHADMIARLQQARDCGWARGPAGYGLAAETIAMLVPAEASDHALAVGFVYGADDRVNHDGLIACLADAMDGLSTEAAIQPTRFEALSSAA